MKTTRNGAKLEHANDKRGSVRDLIVLASEHLAKKETTEAWECAMAAMSRDMDSAAAMYIAGQICLERDHAGLAANLLRRACALRPDIQSNWLGFGAALLDMRQFDEAAECFMKAHRVKPDDPTALANMGALEMNRGRPQDAIEWSRKSLALQDHPAVHGNIGFALLMLRQWGEGFDEYRGSLSGKYRIRRIYRQPEEPDWNGETGHVVVVQGEQGLGDEISFASMIPDLVAKSKKVIIDCHPKLEHIFRRSFPACDVHPTRKLAELEWPLDYEIDSSLPISSLGCHFRRTDADFPRRPWLVPCTDLRQKWREWLDALPGVKVGIAWTGGVFLTNRAGRSATLDDFAPIIRDGVTAISLEYRDEIQAVNEWNERHPTRRVIRPPVDRENYDDMLALMAELDRVVSVTTTVVHACGAIGRACYCVVPSVLTSSQWRYGLDGDEMLWYPPNSVRMFRQHRSEQGLSMVVRRVANAIEEGTKRETPSWVRVAAVA